MNDRPSAGWIDRWAGYSAAVLVIGYFASGQIAAADPVVLGLVGLLFGLGIAADHHMYISSGSGVRSFLAGVILISFLLGGVFLIRTTREADASLTANRSRCAAIQEDMLAAHPRRSDSPDLFQALGCKPRGNGKVYAPPTKREIAAGHPLPRGGYPKPDDQSRGAPSTSVLSSAPPKQPPKEQNLLGRPFARSTQQAASDSQGDGQARR